MGGGPTDWSQDILCRRGPSLRRCVVQRAGLTQLKEKHPGPLRVIWDNAPAHRGEAVREYLQAGEDPDTPARLPPRFPTPGKCHLGFGLGKIPSKVCGATCWTGCSKIRTPVLWHCWADWKKLNRIVSAGLTCVRCSVRCSGGCSSGGASWQASWSTLRPKLRWRTTMECRKWRWPWVTPSADFSVTFLNEAIGTGKYALRGTSRLS